MKGKGIFRGIGILFVLLLLAGGMVIAKDGQRRGKGHDGAKIEKVLKQLDLTDTQKEQIQALRDEFKQENEDVFAEMKELRQTMRQQMQSGDKEAAKATGDQLREKGEELKANGQKLYEQISTILTDEQQQQLADLKEKRGDARQDRKECMKKGKELREELNLSEEQKEAIDQKREEFKADHAEVLEQMKELRKTMRDQMKSGDKEGAAATRDQMKELGASIKEDREDLREEIGTLLTAEQKALLEEQKQKMEECRDAHKDKKGRERGANAKKGTRGEAPANIE